MESPVVRAPAASTALPTAGGRSVMMVDGCQPRGRVVEDRPLRLVRGDLRQGSYRRRHLGTRRARTKRSVRIRTCVLLPPSQQLNHYAMAAMFCLMSSSVPPAARCPDCAKECSPAAERRWYSCSRRSVIADERTVPARVILAGDCALNSAPRGAGLGCCRAAMPQWAECGATVESAPVPAVLALHAETELLGGRPAVLFGGMESVQCASRGSSDPPVLDGAGGTGRPRDGARC